MYKSKNLVHCLQFIHFGVYSQKAWCLQQSKYFCRDGWNQNLCNQPAYREESVNAKVFLLKNAARGDI